ncbi:hypothetical protein GN956_G9 [Arapaima gigas]
MQGSPSEPKSRARHELPPLLLLAALLGPQFALRQTQTSRGGHWPASRPPRSPRRTPSRATAICSDTFPLAQK